MKKTFGIIGLGRFGSSVALTLSKLGYKVLAADKEEYDVQRIKDYVTYALQLDATDVDSLKDAGFKNCDVVIVAIGEDAEGSIMTTANLKEIGVKYVVAKAQNEQQGKILAKIGADRIVFPEHDSGVRLANQLTQSDILEFIEVSPEYIVKELKVPKKFVGKSLRDLRLPNDYRVLVLAIKRGDLTHILPDVDAKIGINDVLVIVGKREDIIRFMKQFKYIVTVKQGFIPDILKDFISPKKRIR